MVFTGRLTEFQVIGRHLPTETNATPKLYRMRIFAPNTTVAKSRFWYFLQKLRKVKKANGEIVSLNIVCEINVFISTESQPGLRPVRSTRNDHRRSRTSAFGSAMILAPALTTCTRNTGKCQERTPLRRSTKTWPLVTALASDLFMYICRSFAPRIMLKFTDSQSRRARENRGCQTTLHEATSPEEFEISSATSCS